MPEYKQILSEVLEAQKEFVGEKQALLVARKSSLEINRDGEIEDFYGSGEVATKVLLQVFYRHTGQAGLNFTRRYLHKRGLEIPEEVEMPSRREGVLERMKEVISSSLKS